MPSASSSTGATRAECAPVGPLSAHHLGERIGEPESVLGFPRLAPMRALTASAYAPLVQLLDDPRARDRSRRRYAAQSLLGLRLTDGGGPREYVLNAPCNQLFTVNPNTEIEVHRLHQDAAIQVRALCEESPPPYTDLLASLILQQPELAPYWHD
ncbi:MAG: hypothetical protein AAFY60_15480, partial [Myxococcota bacterium]